MSDTKHTPLSHKPSWEFCLCYADGEFSHWEWRRHDGSGTIASHSGFRSLSDCVFDAMKHGYTGGGHIAPGIVGSAGRA